MEFREGALKGIQIIKPQVFEDHRGFFLEHYQAKKFEAAGIPSTFVQDNHSRSRKGILRGLHYQLNPHAQGKLIRTTLGEIYDVVVDIRKGSPTYGQYEGFHISATNKLLVYIPPGFAHGFYVISENAEVDYKCTDYYTPSHERCLQWDDPTIGIQWPFNTETNPPILSEKDKVAHPLSEIECNFTVS